MQDNPSYRLHLKTIIKTYRTYTFLCILLLLLLRFTVFRSSSEGVRFNLFLVYAAATWIPACVIHYFETERVLGYLRARFPDRRIWGLVRLKTLLSPEELNDPTIRHLIFNYKRWVKFCWLEFALLPILFFIVMLDRTALLQLKEMIT